MAEMAPVVTHDEDPAVTAGLPASRHRTLALVPIPGTPVGDLLMIVGLSRAGPVPLSRVEPTVRSYDDVLALAVELEHVGAHLTAT